MTYLGETTIETASGRGFDYSAPDPSMICVEDIAHHLSMVCRFAGATSRFYSVAEHAVLVHDIVQAWRYTDDRVGERHLLPALHHDDHEAYLGDVPRPMKPLLGDAWSALVRRVDNAVAAHLGISRKSMSCGVVKHADDLALIVEARKLMRSGGWDWARHEDVQLPEGVQWAAGLNPPAARDLFLSRARLVGRERAA